MLLPRWPVVAASESINVTMGRARPVLSSSLLAPLGCSELVRHLDKENEDKGSDEDQNNKVLSADREPRSLVVC